MKRLLLLLFICFTGITKAQTFPDSTLTGNAVGGGPDLYLNEGITGRFNAFGGLSYTWTPSAGLSDSSAQDPTVTVSDTTTYIVAINVGDTTTVYDTVTVYILAPYSTLATCSNLLTNGDFNTHTAPCDKTVYYNPPAPQPVGYPFTMPDNWVVPTPSCTPDYFNTCAPYPSTYPSVNIPNTFQGNQTAHSGVGMAGFIPYDGTYSPGINYSEYVQQHMPCPLLSGQNYKVQFWVALSLNSGYGCSSLGAYLSSGPLTGTNNGYLSATPQVSSGSVIIGANTSTTTVGTSTVTNNTASHWASVTGTVTGSGQNYITVGCFTGTPSVSLLNSGGNTWPYYFLDDVSIVPLPPVPTTTNVTTCSGATFSLCATGGANYSWTGPGISGSLSGSCVTITAPTVTATTVYQYTVTTTITCPTTCSYTAATSVTVTPSPTISVNSASICAGGSTTLTATGGVTYTWSPGTGLSSTTGSVVTANPSSTTVYTINATTSGGCLSTTTSTVTVIPNPTVTVSNYTICSGSSATVVATGATSYTWNPGSLTGNPVVLSPSSTTVYTVTGAIGSCTNTKTFTVTVNPKPTLAPTATPSVICASVSTNTTALSVSGASTYTWTAPASTTVSCTACTSPTATLSGYSSFTFTVTGTSSLGCTNTATITVTVHQIPTVTVNSATICPGTATTLTASGASTYTWSANAGGATTATVAVSPTVTTNYTVTGTSSTCTNSAVSTVTVKAAPTVPVFTGTLCAGITGTLSVSSGAGYTYSWTPTTGTNSVSCGTCTTVTVNNPGGVYTVVATNTTTGCTASNTYSTNSLPSVSIAAAPTNSYCASSPLTVTLTASGASTYSWNTGATTSTISASPGTTTGYTVTGTASSGCQNTATSTITVIANPTVTPSASPNPICVGVTSTLSATGAGSYTWNPGGLTGATVTVSPSSNTVYTVTGASSGCTANATISLTVTPSGTISVTTEAQNSCNYLPPGTNTICPGGVVTFTASGGFTSYTWTPGALTGSVITVTPTVSTTYTVSGSGGGGCPGTNTVSVTITHCSCPGTNLPTLTSTTITGGTYVLNSNATVSGSVVLNGVDIKIGPNVTITVPVNGNLQIIGSHLSSCFNMWQGIVVDPKASVSITGNSLIEDAIVAIDNNPSNAVQTQSPSIIQVDGAVFNCNYTAIRRAFYQSTSSALYTQTYFKVNDAVITCRCSIPFPISTSSLTVYSNTVTGTPSLSAPDLNDYYSVQNYTSAQLKPPYFGIPAFEGVHLENDGDPAAQTASRLPYVNNVGGSTLVLFDNLTYGINAINATLRDTNSAFQNPRITGAGTRGSPYVGAYAISAVNNDKTFYNGLYVKYSRFIKWVRAVHSINYFDFDVSNNTMWGSMTYGSGGALFPPPYYGEYNIYNSSVRYLNANMNNNKMAFALNGIVFSIANTAGYNGGNGQYVGPMNINNNTIYDEFPGNSYTNPLMENAIAVSNVITTNPSSTVTPVQGTGSFITVQSNTVTNAWNGIYMSNHQWQKVRDEQNTITLKYQPTATTETDQYAIQHAYCFYGTGFGNDIYKNTITGITGGTVQATFEKKRGIWSRYSGNHYVTCNSVSSAGRAFQFEGAHTNTFWELNTMTSNSEGYALTNSGVIGQQPSGGTTASDNQWVSPGSSYADTYTDGTSLPSGSKLLVRSTASYPYGPQINLTSTGTSYGVGTLITNTVASTYACSTVPPMSLTINPRNVITASENTSSARVLATPGNDILFYEQIVQDSIPYPAYYTENSFINKNIVYRIIKSNPSLVDSSIILANFYNNSGNSSYALFGTVEDSLATGNYTYANTLVSGYTPSFSIEQNYKRFYQIYASSMQGDTLSAADSSDLMALATSCPMLNGVVVFQARALRNSLLQGFENYVDNCPENTEIRKVAATEATRKSQLYVYPNPTNEKVYIGGFSAIDKTTGVEVTDITGKLVFKQSVSVSGGLAELLLPLNNGVYLIKITGNSGIPQIEKIIINK